MYAAKLHKFCENHHLEVSVEYSARNVANHKYKYMADLKSKNSSVKGIELQKRENIGYLSGVAKWGDSPVDAMENLAKHIEGNWLVVSFSGTDRRKIAVPYFNRMME